MLPDRGEEVAVETVFRAAQGDERAMEQILTAFKPLVRRKAEPFYMPGAEREDVLQEGMIGLFKAVRTYRADLNVPFAAFAATCVQAQITDAVRKASRLKHQPLNRSVPLDQPAVADPGHEDFDLSDRLPDGEPDPQEAALAREENEALATALSALLSPLENRCLRLFLRKMSYREIAAKLAVSPKTVDNALSRIRRKLLQIRKP